MNIGPNAVVSYSYRMILCASFFLSPEPFCKYAWICSQCALFFSSWHSQSSMTTTSSLFCALGSLLPYYLLLVTAVQAIDDAFSAAVLPGPRLCICTGHRRRAAPPSSSWPVSRTERDRSIAAAREGGLLSRSRSPRSMATRRADRRRRASARERASS